MSAAKKAQMLNIKNLILWHTREEYGDIRQEKFKNKYDKILNEMGLTYKQLEENGIFIRFIDANQIK